VYTAWLRRTVRTETTLASHPFHDLTLKSYYKQQGVTMTIEDSFIIENIVEEGITEISYKLLKQFNIESGDIAPMQQIELDNAKEKLRICLEEWINSRKENT
jgi:hypothetical protein